MPLTFTLTWISLKGQRLYNLPEPCSSNIFKQACFAAWYAAQGKSFTAVENSANNLNVVMLQLDDWLEIIGRPLLCWDTCEWHKYLNVRQLKDLWEPKWHHVATRSHAHLILKYLHQNRKEGSMFHCWLKLCCWWASSLNLMETFGYKDWDMEIPQACNCQVVIERHWL